MMSVNTKKTKVVIFQKKTRKSTLQKYSFFLNDSQIDIVQDYTYLGSTISSNGSFSNSKLKSADKTRRSIFATKRFLDFSNLPIRICNRLFDTLFSPILLYNSEIWGLVIHLILKNRKKTQLRGSTHNSLNYILVSINEHLM